MTDVRRKLAWSQEPYCLGSSQVSSRFWWNCPIDSLYFASSPPSFVCSLLRTCPSHLVFPSFRFSPPELPLTQAHIKADLFSINALIDWVRQRHTFIHQYIPLLRLSLTRKSHYFNPNGTFCGGTLKRTSQ